MAFDQELRAYLEGLSIPLSSAQELAHRRINEDDLRQHFLKRLREPGSSAAWVTVLHSSWTPRLGRFARHLEKLPPHVAPTDPDAAQGFARRAIDQALWRLDPHLALVDKLELQRILAEFNRLDGDMESYALETRLTGRDAPGQPGRLTKAGRGFLRMRGKDGVRWLLTLELLQSTGDHDAWRASRKLLQEAMSVVGITTRWYEGQAYFPYDNATLKRLASMGALVASYEGPEEEEPDKYAVPESMRDVVEAVLSTGPWHNAIGALLEDERAEVIPAAALSATEATIDLTRMITHEVRNALVPARHHMDALLIAIDSTHQSRVESARRGVVRVLEFVDKMVATAELVSEPDSACDVIEVVREVLARVDEGERVEIASTGPIRVRAPRSALLIALSNVVSNALQATTSSQAVRVSAEQRDGVTTINVDDAGPGVRPETRAKVFDDGFTTRVGGSGFGLAYVKRIVEDRLRGRVWCEDSDLGGARFVMTIPEEVSP